MNPILANYHTHNHFCDGKEAPEEYVKKAISLGFKALGFSSHAPVLFENDYSILPEKLGDYCTEIERLKKVYSEKIDLFLALFIFKLLSILVGISLMLMFFNKLFEIFENLTFFI